jgi:hypothetical protein
VVAVSLKNEVYVNGTQGAFGGALASLDGSDAAARDPRTIPQRAGAAVGRAHEEADQRRGRLLGE